MAAGNPYCRSGNEHARARHGAFRNRVAKRNIGKASRTDIPDRRIPRHEGRFSIHNAINRVRVRRHTQCGITVILCVPHQMDVHVDHARHDCIARKIYGFCAFRHGHRRKLADRNNLAVFNQNPNALH